jgi:hypothetical protein
MRRITPICQGCVGIETDGEQLADLDPFAFFALQHDAKPVSLRSNSGHCSTLRSRLPNWRCDRRFGALGDEAIQLDVENLFGAQLLAGAVPLLISMLDFECARRCWSDHARLRNGLRLFTG